MPTFRSLSRRSGPTLLALIAALLLPGAAGAQVVWQAPQPPLTPVLTNVSDIRLAMGAGGHAGVVWEANSGTSDVIQAALRAPGGNVALPSTISSGSPEAPEVAIDGSGNAAAAWDGSNGITSFVYGAFRPAGGAFATGTPLSAAGQSNGFTLPKVAFGPGGAARVVWTGATAAGPPTAIYTNTRPLAGPFSGASTASAPVAPGGDQPDQQQLAIAPDGSALLVWRWEPAGSNRIYAAYKPAASSTFQAQVEIPGSTGGFRPQVAWAGNGEFTVVWHVSNTILRASTRSVAGAYSAGTTIGSAFATTNPINPQGTEVQISSNASGLVAAAFIDAGGAPRVAVKEPGQWWAGNTNLINGGNGAPAGTSARWADAAVSDSGAIVAVWRYDNGTVDSIRTLTRPPGGTFPTTIGVFGDQISPAGVDADKPQVGIDAQGNTIAAWELFSGGNIRAQVALGLLPETAPAPDPPPPTPDPPPPPNPPAPGVAAVTDIEIAAPIRRNAPVVLSAQTAGPVTKLEWTVDGTRIDGETIGGTLQRSVRFRPRDQRFTVQVRAVGPGASAPALARAYAQPRLRARSRVTTRQGRDDIDRALAELKSSDIKSVATKLERQARVAAVGAAGPLLGEAGCPVPTTVESARLELTGCLRAVPSLGDIPARERGVLQSIGSQLDIPTSDTDAMKAAVALSDGFLTDRDLQLPGGFPIEVGSGASIVSFPQAKALASSNAAFRIGGELIKQQGGFVLPLDPRSAALEIGRIARPPKLPKIGGFDLTGDFDVTLVNGEAVIKATVKLPSFLKVGGVDIQSGVTLRATPSAFIIDDLTIGPINVNIAALRVDAFRIRYTRATDEWQGQGRACLVSGLCLDMVPPNGQVKIKQGRLDFAGASLNFPLPGVVLFPGLTMERIGFGIGLNPTRLVSNTRIAIASIIAYDGRMVTAFPSAGQPFVLRRDEVGNGFAPALYGQQYTRPTVGVSAEAFVKLPAVGEVRLGNSYLLYEYPGYAAFGGAVDLSLVDIISFKGAISGELDAPKGLFNLHGDVRACVDLVVAACGSAAANVSRGPNNAGGAGGCVNVAGISIGGGLQWARPTKPLIWPFDGCRWSPFALKVRAASAQANRPVTVRIKKGEPGRAVQLNGAGGAPLVRVTGPGGLSVESAPGSGLTTGGPGRRGRILRYEGAAGTFTVVGVQDPPPGTYTITPLPGSPAITGVSEANDLPDAKVSGRVTGSGEQRTFTYDVVPRPNQTVIFREVGSGSGLAREIGRIRGGGRGTLRFRSAPGRGLRRITAQFELGGVPAELRTVTRLRPPAPFLAAPRRLSASRRGGRLRIRWAPVQDAERYEVVVTPRTGSQRLLRVRTPRATVRVARSTSGKVTVRAVSKLREGRLSSVRLRAGAKADSTLKSLPRCTGTRKITCRA